MEKLTRVGVTSKTYNFGAQGYGGSILETRERQEGERLNLTCERDP